MSHPVAQFYDGLADRYELLFDDWWEAAEWHGAVVSSLLVGEGLGPGSSVLDCTCGIGTQALPLAAAGYRLTGSDISAAAIERARAEAVNRQIDIDLQVLDVRAVGGLGRTFDAVISFDNALPHLLTEEDLAAAASSIRQRLEPDGVFLASIRDYDALARERAQGLVPSLSGQAGHRRGVAQSWIWSENSPTVDITLFVLEEQDDKWNVTVHESTYRAWSRNEFGAVLEAAGFDRIRWLMPDETGYYQPVLAARVAAMGPI